MNEIVIIRIKNKHESPLKYQINVGLCFEFLNDKTPKNQVLEMMIILIMKKK